MIYVSLIMFKQYDNILSWIDRNSNQECCSPCAWLNLKCVKASLKCKFALSGVTVLLLCGLFVLVGLSNQRTNMLYVFMMTKAASYLCYQIMLVIKIRFYPPPVRIP
jgi:hypothetical protein